MSDSASKKDVEDVLTSVRRLVSSELPRNRRADLPEGRGALVLTDAQRIERPTGKSEASKSLEDRIAELEAAVSTRPDEYEPDGSEDQSMHRPDRIVYSRPPSDAEQADMREASARLRKLSLVETRTPEVQEEATEDEPAVAFKHVKHAHPEPEALAEPEAPMAEDVEALPREKAEVRPFHNPDEMLDRFEARIKGDDMTSNPGPGHNGFSERLESYQAEEDAETDESPEPNVAEDAPAEPRAGTVDEAVEPDAQDEEFERALSAAVAAPEPKAEEAAPESVAEAAVVAPSASESPAETAGDKEVLAALDEAALRDIVAKLIREELQGELGERITRNVRKLVRREILRAMASREFE